MGNASQSAVDDFADFVASGDVEVGASNLQSQAGDAAEPEPKPVKKPAPPKPAARQADVPEGDGEGEGEGSEDLEHAEDTGDAAGDGEGDEEDVPKPKKSMTPSERIRDLNKRLRQSERLRQADKDHFELRLSAIEKGGLQNGNSAVNSDAIGEAPSPLDTEKYPLGHLDDRYIEDKLEWLAAKKAAEQADAVLQRQQETERSQQVQQAQTRLLEKVDEVATRGMELYDDFQEVVVEAGMRGDWPLDQTTFEAAHEADNGAQILYELSQDPVEAKRIANLSPLGQLKFVQARDAEITAKSKPRRIPGAGEPPQTQPRGANSKTQIRPDTDNLDEFAKLWESDAKKSRN